MQTLPSGTVTFLFTDIEGSTKSWETNAQLMGAALARHDAILREAIETNSGYVFKTVGDAFCAAFPTPITALEAAFDIQIRLSSELPDMKVREALHTGMADERAGDYFGPTLNRVARLLSAGHGSQILLSGVSADLVRDYLPQRTGVSELGLLDLGEHRLKDLTRPEHVFQLTGIGLPSAFPPLRTLDNRPNNLPRQITALIGREKEIEDVCRLLGRPDTALVTLTGPGGIGKTRLGLQVGAEMLDDFSDGVWFVDLSPIEDPNLVALTIAQTFGLREAAGQPIVDTLKGHLREKQLLLLLDNFEQVVEASGQVSSLLASCPHLKVLVTSRVPLRVRGEKEYAVSALDLPDIRHLPPLERLTQYEAVRLFIERATDVKADFEVTNENAPAVAEICARLDGLPLAIELAAARTKLFAPQALLSRLSSRLKLLTGGAKDLPARQQTLRGAMEWSYDLLEEEEKQLFWRMAAFNGGRTLEALEAVCNYDGQLLMDVLDGAQSLVDKSLLQQREGSDGEPRFWMLETIHEFAREKLQESGEVEVLQREHALYFIRLAEEAEPHLVAKEQQEWLDRLEDDYDNIRAALQWARDSTGAEEIEAGLRLAVAMWRFWQRRGYFSEGREQLSSLLALQPVGLGAGEGGGARAELVKGPAAQGPKQYRARALHGAGVLAESQGDYATARSLLEESLTLQRELGDKWGIAASLNNLGLVAHDQADYTRARSLLEASLAIRRELGDKSGIAGSLNNLAMVAQEQGDYTTARSFHEESLTLQRELGDKWGIAGSLNGLGIVAQEQGDYATARSFHEESLTLQRELGDKSGIAASLNNLGIVAQSQGDYATARSLLEESLTLQRELGDKRGIAVALSNLGLVAGEQGDYTTARSLLEENLALQRELGDKYGIALSLAGLGRVVVDTGGAERGAKVLGAVEALLESIGGALYSEDRVPYERAVASARSQVGDETFERAWQEGRGLSMEQVIKYALGRTTDGE